MNGTLYVAQIKHSTSADGVGLRNALYVSGCHLHCEGCHNSSIWPLTAGTPLAVKEVYRSLLQDDFNISILGGEPLLQYEPILQLCQAIKANHPQKTIWLWSGYTHEYIKRFHPEILRYIDVLVDGPYIASLHTTQLPWRGSSNQRVIELR